jgi:hypothetical protein
VLFSHPLTGANSVSDNHWRIYQGDVRSSIGPSVQQVSCVDATVLPFALVLRFKFPSGQSRTVPVLADQLSPDAYRKLRQLASFVCMS